jgi:flagellar hook assembly protein FlgD
MRTRLVIAVVAALALSMPASAMAAARYASPTGSGTACTAAAPCDLVTAINNAQSGDDVTIEPGSYNVTTTLDDNGFTLTIHGQAGAARPVITNSMTNGIDLMGPGSRVSDLELDITSTSGAGIGTSGQQTIDRVIVKITNTSNNVPACTVTGTMTDSICWSAGTNGEAVFNGNDGVTAAATLRNDTVEATGSGGIGVFVQGFGSAATPSIALVNSIAHGAGKDILVNNINGNSAAVTADHSNFAISMATGTGASAPAPGSGTNQTPPPRFTDAVTGDFHELGTSPTVEAGLDSALNGSLDFDGLPRMMGAHTDIGAFEYAVPVCQAATATVPFDTTSTMQLHCADPSGAPITSYTIVTPPEHGTVSVNSTGTATYSPASGYSGPDNFTFDATSGHGTGAPATATITVSSAAKIKPPILSHVGQSHRRWRRGSALPHIASARPPVGTTFRFTVNESIKMRFAFTQRRHGHRVTRGTLRFSVGAGTHEVRFKGRLSKHKKLKPGRYTLIISATNAVGQRATARLVFVIVR